MLIHIIGGGGLNIYNVVTSSPVVLLKLERKFLVHMVTVHCQIHVLVNSAKIVSQLTIRNVSNEIPSKCKKGKVTTVKMCMK